MFSLIFTSPLEQFTILYIKSINIVYPFFIEKVKFEAFYLILKITLISNINIVIFLSLFFIFFLTVVIKNLQIIPSKVQYIIENVLLILEKVFFESNSYKNQKFLPLIISVAFLLFFCNIIGMIPYQFTLTAQLSLTFTLSFILFFAININSIILNKRKYLGLFLPSGTPLLISPFLVVIEFISYFSRVFSMAIRMFANLMSGHTLIGILTFFLYQALNSSFIFAFLLEYFLILIVLMLELSIALVQVYVFTILLSLYIKDTYNTDH